MGPIYAAIIIELSDSVIRSPDTHGIQQTILESPELVSTKTLIALGGVAEGSSYTNSKTLVALSGITGASSYTSSKTLVALGGILETLQYRGTTSVTPYTTVMEFYDFNDQHVIVGDISGTVYVYGVPQNNLTVFLYNRVSGALVSTTSTDSDGYYIFYKKVPIITAGYFVVAVTNQLFNALVFDKVTPRESP